MNNNSLESMLEEYQDTILKLRNVYTRIEQKLKEEGFNQEDADIFLDKKFKEINKNANSKQQQQKQEQEQVQQVQQNNNNITNKGTSNNNNNNNFPLYFRHSQ
jgi:hypothetical protein